MIQKFNVGICTFSYGGNGGISSEVPDIREWMIPVVLGANKDERIGNIRIWNLADTPITMTRNRAVLMAREFGIDVMVMVDSDMKPDINAGQPDAKPWFQSSFDFLVNHYHKGPCVIGAPYCGPPPQECVYVFRWQNMQSENQNPDFQLEMYDRHTAHKLAGIQECAALPTGLIMYDMRAFELTEPRTEADKPWFYYEWNSKYCSEKVSTEDVTLTRDLSMAGAQKLGYNPVYCNWDAWAGHWKPKCVGKPQIIDASGVSGLIKAFWDSKADSSVKLVDLATPKWLKQHELQQQRATAFISMGMDTPERDLEALKRIIQSFHAMHGRRPYVCEVGSWAGRSAIAMSQAGADVLCVDTWEGSKNDEGCKAYNGEFGTPFEVFKRNVSKYPIGWHQAKSPVAALHFDDQKFDIVYIDAEHDYESVKADILAWKRKAKHIIAGHDYHAFPGVQKAVRELFENYTTDGDVWYARL